MSEKNTDVTVEARIPADLVGPVAVEASKRGISLSEFISATVIATVYGVTHPFVAGIFGFGRGEKGADEEQEL